MTLKCGLEVTHSGIILIECGSNSKSLKTVPFKSLSKVSYSPSIVTMAVSLAISEIFSVKSMV